VPGHGRTLHHRPARLASPAVPDADVEVQPPPADAAGPARSLWPQLVFPGLMALGGAAFALSNPRPLFIAMGAVMVVGSIGYVTVTAVQQRSGGRRRARRLRDRYLDYLDELAANAEETARAQYAAGRFTHPGLPELHALACQRVRVWERRPEHPDFATVRLGLGMGPLSTALRLDEGGDQLVERDPDLLAAVRRLVARHGRVHDQPLLLDLRARPSVSLIGRPDDTRPLAAAVMTELATLCAPDDLAIAVCHPPEAAAAWEFAKWLPHAELEDGRALLCDSADRLEQLLSEEVARRRDRARRRAGALDPDGTVAGRAEMEPQRHLLLVVDGFSAASPMARNELLAELGRRARELEVSLLFLVDARREEPGVVDARVEVRPDRALTVGEGSDEPVTGWADGPDPAVCEAIARRLTPLRIGDRDARSALTTTWRLADLLGLAGPDDLRPERIWRERSEREQLRVPLGVAADGEPLVLDLKEPALDGMGPHGLVVGATGSGKSELLRTLTVGLVVTHPPELLSLVLVDFKGGATFAGMAELPHVAGMITNLQGDLALVDRMYDALTGEQLRRQELLRRAGNVDSIRQYHRLRAAGADLEPMPFLLVIVDEFGELLASRPDFVDLFVAIGRVGRSLGMHLLMASQRLEEGRLRGLESHLSYRIALRVFNAMESRIIIGVTDAYTLPPTPGSAYLKTDAAAARRFRVASASLPYAAEVAASPSAQDVEPFTARGLGDAGREGEASLAPAGTGAGAGPALATGPSTLEIVVSRLRDVAPSAHQVWLPPLEPVLALGGLLPALERDPVRGLNAVGWPGAGRLQVPVGIVDRPRDQAREVLVLDFAGAAGHLAIVGAPQSGKSTLLRTLVASLALTHTPLEVQVYAVDFGGGGLQGLERLPHVGTVCGRFDPERVQRVVGELSSLIDRRERLFRSRAIESMPAFRALRSTGMEPDDAFGDVFLLIDNWAAVRQEFEDLEPAVLDIAARGLGYGVHLVITANRWMEVRSNLRDNVGGRLELRLNEPADSEVDRRLAALVTAALPGRGLTSARLFFQGAVPRVDGRASVDGLQGAADDLVARVSEAWSGPVAPPARVLPRELPAESLLDSGADSGPGVPIGLAEPAIEPLRLDLAGGEPHFLVFGDGESGKTNLWRVFLTGLVARSAPAAAQVVVVDYRRTLLDVVPEPFLRAYAPSSVAAAGTVQRLVEVLVSRLPGADVSAAQLRERSWWSGPELYVVVDDYDLVVTPGSLNPLAPLADFLAQGRDLGFHLLVARRAGGAGRAVFETVLQRLRDLGTPGILLSGDRQEGQLLGPNAPAPQPPGRGLLVRRRQPACLVQVAWLPPRPPGG
jgi:S-DNA-T family DNA segregation ATPase FtsK/SpoIIIE